MTRRRPQALLAPLAVLAAAAALAACGDSGSGSGPGPGSSQPSAQRWPTPDWEVASPAEEGMDGAVLDQARAYAFAPERNTQGVVVVRNGAIVGEWYAAGSDAGTLATSWSTAKSFASTLVGIAIDRGELRSVDVALADFFPDWRGDERREITLRHLLQMRSGLAWDETGETARFHIDEADQLAASQVRPAARPPGTQFNYSSADSMLISGVIEQATGRNAADFAQEMLFAPIGMQAEWWTDAAGHALTYCCIDTTTRGFARFGLLLARGGEWDGRQVVSRDWIEEATTPPADLPFYALHWWTNRMGLVVDGVPVRLFVSRGLHDQNVYVFPELDLVVVRNGIYDRIGDAAVRSGGNFLTTLSPRGWDEVAFLDPILRSIDPLAETAGVAELAEAAAVVDAATLP